MKERKDDKKEYAEDFLGELPIFGNFFKELAKAEPFKERFKEVNKQIEENLKKDEKNKWNVETNISIRPLSLRPSSPARSLVREEERISHSIFLGEDYMYSQKDGKLILAIKVPQKGVNLDLKGKILEVTSNGFKKEIRLPSYFRNIEKKDYKNGVLVIKLS